MSMCSILYLCSIAGIAIAMTTPSVPTSTEAMMVPNMQFLSGQTTGSWNGMNRRGQGRDNSWGGGGGVGLGGVTGNWGRRNGGNSGAGSVIPGVNGGRNIGMGGGGRRSNVDKTIRTQATLNSQDEVLLRMAGAGCSQDWTHVNGGVDPFCIRLLMMYPTRGM